MHRMGINWVEDPKIRLAKNARQMPNGCIEWTGYVHKQGYGRTSLGKGRDIFVHRLSYAVANELDPFTLDGMVLHSCDNRLCFNPAHLRLGTHADNTKDMLLRNRSAKGVKQRNAKLDENKVTDILQDSRSLSAIAREYGISPTTVLHVKQRKIWKHVPSDVLPYEANQKNGTPIRSKNPRKY